MQMCIYCQCEIDDNEKEITISICNSEECQHQHAGN